MKFDLMYYLGMNHNEIMRLDLAELQYYYSKLREVKEQEFEIEKMKMEASLAAAGAGAAKKTFAG
jgi:hypothetical protein